MKNKIFQYCHLKSIKKLLSVYKSSLLSSIDITFFKKWTGAIDPKPVFSGE